MARAPAPVDSDGAKSIGSVTLLRTRVSLVYSTKWGPMLARPFISVSTTPIGVCSLNSPAGVTMYIDLRSVEYRYTTPRWVAMLISPSVRPP